MSKNQVFQRTPQPTHSAWGHVVHATELAPGVWQVDTEGHGGIILSPERIAALPEWAKRQTPWSRVAGQYEEDCDWVIPTLAFPEVLEAKQERHNRFARENGITSILSIKNYAVKVLNEHHHSAYAALMRDDEHLRALGLGTVSIAV